MGEGEARPTTGAPEVGGRAVPPTPPRSHRGTIVGVVVVAVVAAVALAVALAVGALDREPVATPTPEVVTLPSPTPTVAPVAREPLSAFADSLPASVLGYALATLVEEPPLLVAGAVEGYRLTYSDGADGVVTVLAGQWPTAEEAAAALAATTAGATPVDDGEPTSGEVLVAGAPAGTWTLTQTAAGAGAMTWTNGSVVLQAVAPLDVVRDVYAAYPL